MGARRDNKEGEAALVRASPLVALLDNVPEAVLTEYGLAEVLQTLKQMTRLYQREGKVAQHL